MKQFYRTIVRLFYQHVFKPVAFRMQPDGVHAGMIKSGRIVQRFPVLPKYVLGGLAHRDEKFLAQNVCGLDFLNPIGLSAGLDKNAEIVPVVHAVGFGFATVGSITAEAASGNPHPWYHRLPYTKSLVVNAGLPNHGVKVIGERIAGYDSKLFDQFPLCASIAKTNSAETCTDDKGVADYVTGIKVIVAIPAVRLIEINISCPNAFGGEPFTRTEPLEALLSKVDELTLVQPVFIKMPIDKPWSDFDKLLQVVVRHNVAGVTIGNLQKNRSRVDLKDPLPESIPGNLSGAPCFEDSNNLIRRTFVAYGDRLKIIGVGGVFTAEDAYVKIKAGATLVDMITGLIFNGPQVVGDINHGLVELLNRDGYANVSEAIGVDATAHGKNEG